MVSYTVGITCTCSIHFQSDCFEDLSVRQSLMELPKNVRNLKFEAVPTLYLPNDETETIFLVAKRPRLLEDVQSISQYSLTEFICNEVEDDIAFDNGIQIRMSSIESETSKLREKIAELEKENSDLVNKIETMKQERRITELKLERSLLMVN
ncbi:hypothetical protein HHI36_012574 [Cryptolaemus montrouzieri]|uniref:Uncharacterized protein n=1 Tax=Cryptolaemus montrouzieri TaxID=559131 RepID=A0ABD2NF90_9CUCU